MEAQRAPPEGGGKAGPKCSGLLRNRSVHTQITEGPKEECCDTGLHWPSSTMDGQKDSGHVMPEFDCIFTMPRTLKIQLISFILRSAASASPTAFRGKIRVAMRSVWPHGGRASRHHWAVLGGVGPSQNTGDAPPTQRHSQGRMWPLGLLSDRLRNDISEDRTTSLFSTHRAGPWQTVGEALSTGPGLAHRQRG